MARAGNGGNPVAEILTGGAVIAILDGSAG
jgi:hypothetical protein